MIALSLQITKALEYGSEWISEDSKGVDVEIEWKFR